MPLTEQIEGVKADLRQGKFTSEASVSQGILLAILRELGWNIFDTSLVTPEYSVENSRVDFALCCPPKKPIVFIEVKKVGNLSEAADRQLFEYIFHAGVPMAVLTDGREWSFYLPSGEGRYDERRVYKLDMLERETDECAERLNRYLSYERVCSGEALESAKSDYQNVAQGREIERTFPKAWNALLEEPDSLLLGMLAEKVADLCGYKPEPRACEQFLESIRKPDASQESSSSERNISQHTYLQVPRTQDTISSRTRRTGNFGFLFKGTRHQASSAKEVLTKVFALFAQEDPKFLERFAADPRARGKTRNYLARNKEELYPNTPGLASSHSYPIQGWWLATHHGRDAIKKILDVAIEVSGLRPGEIEYNLE